MFPDYCPRCGAPTKTLIPDPRFCSSCQLALIGAVESRPAPASPAPDTGGEYNPFPALDAGTQLEDAIWGIHARYSDGILPLNVGVIAMFESPVQARLPMHRDNLGEKMKDPSAVLPYNCMARPLKTPPQLWRDARGNLVSRAAAITYYWGGFGFSRAWHFSEALDADNIKRLVTTTDETIDFELRFNPDMLNDNKMGEGLVWSRVVSAALTKLREYLEQGVNTKNRNIQPVGAPISWAVFGMDELAKEHRP